MTLIGLALAIAAGIVIAHAVMHVLRVVIVHLWDAAMFAYLSARRPELPLPPWYRFAHELATGERLDAV